MKILILTLVIAILLSIIVLSQLSPITNVISKVSQVTPTISLEESKTCTTIFYDEVQPIIENCIYYHNLTSCLNSSGPNTACSTSQNTFSYSCKTGEVIVRKNSTNCEPINKFTIIVNKGTATEKKEIDFSRWGVCVNSAENNCLAITCGTLKGGSARNGIFNGCDGGKSCQKFLFCDDGVKVLYKASRGDFVGEDPTFHLDKQTYREVSK